MSATSSSRLHGYMWRMRELLARGDVDAVKDEIARYAARGTGPIHPLDASYGDNVAALMALVAGDVDQGEALARQALEEALPHNELAHGFYAALMIWTWWQRDELASMNTALRAVVAQSPADSPSAHAAQALAHAEAGETEEALAQLHWLSDLGWDNVGDRSESVTPALAAAACAGLGMRARESALRIYEEMRPYAGTAVVIRPPAVACLGPADYYLGLLAMTSGDLALSQVHFEAALRLGFRMRSAPFVAAAEVELARALRRRRARRRGGAGGRAPAECGGVRPRDGPAPPGPHCGRPGLTPGIRWPRRPPRPDPRPPRGRRRRLAGRPLRGCGGSCRRRARCESRGCR